MRFHQSLDYMNNIHSLNSFGGDNNNGNIGTTISSTTVKTFTSNGNHQTLTKPIDRHLLPRSPQNETNNFNFLSNYHNDSVRQNSLTIEALSHALNSTTGIELENVNVEPDAIVDDDGGNRTTADGEISNGNAGDECGDLLDLETNINHMITRGNLYKLNFDAAETELDLIEQNLSGSIECLASSPDDSFMEDGGKHFFLFSFGFVL